MYSKDCANFPVKKWKRTEKFDKNLIFSRNQEKSPGQTKDI